MLKLKRAPKVLLLLEDELSLQNTALIYRHSKRNLAEDLEISDELTAYELDVCCAYLCMKHDNERDAKRLEIELNSMCAMLGGKPKMSSGSEDDDLEAY